MNNKLSGGLYETKDQILACLFLSTQGDRPHLPEHKGLSTQGDRPRLPEHKGQTPFFRQLEIF